MKTAKYNKMQTELLFIQQFQKKSSSSTSCACKKCLRECQNH